MWRLKHRECVDLIRNEMKIVFLAETHEGLDCVYGLRWVLPSTVSLKKKSKYAEGGDAHNTSQMGYEGWSKSQP